MENDLKKSFKSDSSTPQSAKRYVKINDGVRNISGTPLLEHYYETGELPKDEALRKLFQIMIEKGEIRKVSD